MVSVIIPNYNHAAYLQQRIESVLTQTFQDLEIIILDDASSDNSRNIIESYRGHPKVSRIIYNQSNSGNVFRQWETGIGLSAGEYIWIAESDDYADKKFLELMVPLLQNDPKLGFAYCDSFIVLDEGKEDPKTFSDYRVTVMQKDKWKSSYTKNGKDEIKESLVEMCTVNNASAVLFRRSALLEVQPFDREFKYFGDWYCYLKICQKYSLSYLNQPLNYYRDHSVNVSKNMPAELQYVFEYFNLTDWMLKNLDFINEKWVRKRLVHKASHSLVRKWNSRKLQLYKKLRKLNPSLFWYLIRKTFFTSISSRFRKNKNGQEYKYIPQ